MRRLVPCLGLALALIAHSTVASAEGQRYVVTDKGRVSFDAFHPFTTFTVTSESPSGEIELDTADLKQPFKGEIIVLSASLRSGDRKRDQKIYNSLDIERYPDIRYRIEKVDSSFGTLAENNDVLLVIRGVLIMKGLERPVDFSGRLRLRPGGGLWFRGESWIKPWDWGVQPIRLWLISVRETGLATFDLILNKAE